MSIPRNLSFLAQGASSTGVLSVSYGGTGATTLTANNVLLGNGTSAFQVVAPGTNGNILTSNGTTWTSAAAPAGSAWTTIKKTTDQSITSSTTFVDDNQLQFSMVQNSIYCIRGCYFMTLNGGGQKFACNGPAANRLRAMISPTNAAITAYNTNIWATSGGGAIVAAFDIEVSVSSSPGTFAMRIAQFASNAGATVFEAGSWIEYMKVT